MKALALQALRLIIASLITAVLALPLALLAFIVVKQYLAIFPTIYLLGLIGAISLTGFITILIFPSTLETVNEKIVPGSFNYYIKIRQLSDEINRHLDITSLLDFTKENIARYTGARGVAIINE